MKKVLKKSEIIERLHDLLGAKSLDIVCFSCIDVLEFYKVYCLLINHHDLYQVVIIDLHFGWVEWFIYDTYTKLTLARQGYLEGIRSHIANINLQSI